jgi:hypothetical protein
MSPFGRSLPARRAYFLASERQLLLKAAVQPEQAENPGVTGRY